MSLFIPAKRATVLVPSGPTHDPDRKHLFIVLTDVSDDKKVVVVSVSSIGSKTRFDGTCKLGVGDHPFIKHPSFVEYRHARIEEAQKLTNGVTQGLFSAQGMLDEKVYAYVVQGLENSDFTPPKVFTFYKENH